MLAIFKTIEPVFQATPSIGIKNQQNILPKLFLIKPMPPFKDIKRVIRLLKLLRRRLRLNHLLKLPMAALILLLVRLAKRLKTKLLKLALQLTKLRPNKLCPSLMS
jgi:hypothetical protein